MSATIKFHINAGTLQSLPENSIVPRIGTAIDYNAVRAAGFSGVQAYVPDLQALKAGLEMSGMAHILSPTDAKVIAQQHADWGFVASTWHVGHGLENDQEVNALIEAVLNASHATGLPIYIETHRATITQDIRRTLDMTTRFPEIRFNADLSHWYTGLEMTYGDFAFKQEQLQPVFKRTRFIHGRIGHSCMMQLPLHEAKKHQCWDDYASLWQGCLNGFKETATKDETLIFAPELLPASLEYEGKVYHINYAKLVNGAETSDRWAEAIELKQYFKNIAANQD